MQLILLAAGRGSRLPKQFRSKPKCLVKINRRTILDYNKEFFKLFKKKIIVSGFKNYKLKKYISSNNFIEVHNKKFQSTNMVASMFKAKNKITNDVVICYGDIIFDKSIYQLLKGEGNIMPVNINWLKLWKTRMNKNEIINDAEDIKIKNNKLISIGGKIKKKFPISQYMGIFKLKKKSFFNIYKFFIKNKNSKIDMTNFLNLCIKNNLLKMHCKNYKKQWFEIDTANDIKSTSKILNSVW